MYSSTSASVPIVSWMKRTRSSSFSSSSTTEACEMPIEASSVRDFTISGKRSRRGLLTRRPRGNTRSRRAACGGTRAPSWRAPCRATAPARASCSRCRGPSASSRYATTLASQIDTSSKASTRLKAICGWKSASALRIGPRSPPTPSTCTSWPRPRSACTTSYSVFHSACAASCRPAVAGGTRLSCTSASTRSLRRASRGGLRPAAGLTAAPGGGPAAGASWCAP